MIVFAATGHRPDKLGGYGDDVTQRLRRLACWFFESNRPDHVISGMALGWDMAWAEAAIEMHIPVTAAVPFAGQESAWPAESQHRYREILSMCAQVEIVCDGGYGVWKMQKRNQWMVDHSDWLIALWDGSPGGTANAVKYATGRPAGAHRVHNLWPWWSANAF